MISVSICLAADYATSKDDTRTFDGSAENISAIAGTTAILPCSVDLSNSEPSKEVCFKITAFIGVEGKECIYDWFLNHFIQTGSKVN